MSGAAALRPLLRVRGAQQAFGHVLAGVLLDGEAVQLAAFLDPVFLAEAGWDPARRVLSLPAGHALPGCGRCNAARFRLRAAVAQCREHDPRSARPAFSIGFDDRPLCARFCRARLAVAIGQRHHPLGRQVELLP